MTTNPKERAPEPLANKHTAPSPECQDKTLVLNNAIFENMAHFKVYDHCVIFRKRSYQVTPREQKRKNRGRIQSFSKRSRFRLFQLLSMIRNDLDTPPLFVTLTYHHGHENDPRSTKSHLHNFLVQLRNYDPDVQFIWRIELQKRGAPHYHIIIFPSIRNTKCTTEHYFSQIRFLWHSIGDPKSRKHEQYGCLIKTVRSYREACNYMSKYIAKPLVKDSEDVEGKHWGNSRNLPIKLRRRYGNWDKEAAAVISKLLLWMRDNGKGKYADEYYINVFSNFTVFIERTTFTEMISEEDFFFRDY